MLSLSLVVKHMGASRWRPHNKIPTSRAYVATRSPQPKAVVYDQHGPPNQVTRVIDLLPVELRENGVCAKMFATPINPSDINNVEGVYPVRPPVPTIGEYEGVGEVHALGSTVMSLSGEIPEPALGFIYIGGNAASVVPKLLRQGGTMVTYGGMSKKLITTSTSSFIFKDLDLRGFWLQNWTTLEKAKDYRAKMDYLLSSVHSGNFKYEMELLPFMDFSVAVDKALNK